ncbi:hypothetical protein [Paenibacillus foliorum]|nr:hypothetical protein [Paenibacillus foliorum]
MLPPLFEGDGQIHPELLEAAKAELNQYLEEELYVCPIPPDVKPSSKK